MSTILGGDMSPPSHPVPTPMNPTLQLQTQKMYKQNIKTQQWDCYWFSSCTNAFLISWPFSNPSASTPSRAIRSAGAFVTPGPVPAPNWPLF